MPPGTNGGMSLLGTFASVFGGIVVGSTMLLSLLVESAQCRVEWYDVALQLLVWGAFAGLFGSLVCSFVVAA